MHNNDRCITLSPVFSGFFYGQFSNQLCVNDLYMFIKNIIISQCSIKHFVLTYAVLGHVCVSIGVAEQIYRTRFSL